LTTQPNTLEQPVVREQIKAAILDGKSDSAIAKVHGVTRQAIHFFRRRHAAELAPVIKAIEKSIEDYAIASKLRRVAAMDDRWQRGIALIQARAADTRYQSEPGYSTGIMVHRLKSVGSGDSAEIVDEFAFDSSLYASLLALETAVSDQMGQTPRPDTHVGDQNIFIFEVIAPRDHGGIPQLG
jgi:hypothetical protein